MCTCVQFLAVRKLKMMNGKSEGFNLFLFFLVFPFKLGDNFFFKYCCSTHSLWQLFLCWSTCIFQQLRTIFAGAHFLFGGLVGSVGRATVFGFESLGFDCQRLCCEFYPRERYFTSISSLYPGVSGYQFYLGSFQGQIDVLSWGWWQPPVSQMLQKSEIGSDLMAQKTFFVSFSIWWTDIENHWPHRLTSFNEQV